MIRQPERAPVQSRADDGWGSGALRGGQDHEGSITGDETTIGARLRGLGGPAARQQEDGREGAEAGAGGSMRAHGVGQAPATLLALPSRSREGSVYAMAVRTSPSKVSDVIDASEH